MYGNFRFPENHKSKSLQSLVNYKYYPPSSSWLTTNLLDSKFPMKRASSIQLPTLFMSTNKTFIAPKRNARYYHRSTRKRNFTDRTVTETVSAMTIPEGT